MIDVFRRITDAIRGQRKTASETVGLYNSFDPDETIDTTRMTPLKRSYHLPPGFEVIKFPPGDWTTQSWAFAQLELEKYASIRALEDAYPLPGLEELMAPAPRSLAVFFHQRTPINFSIVTDKMLLATYWSPDGHVVLHTAEDFSRLIPPRYYAKLHATRFRRGILDPQEK